MGTAFDGRTSVVPAVFAVVALPTKVGWKRTCVTASKPEANLISVGSLKAVPMKLMPIGSPKSFGPGALSPSTFAAGTLMIGYPGGPANPELANRKWSVSTRSVVQAGLSVGARSESR